jgi:hypothetical protein
VFENVPRRRSWPQRELNPCLDRERVASLPLDDGAKWSQRDSNPCFRLERAASSPLDDGTIGRPARAVNYSASRKPVPIALLIVPRDALCRPSWVREIYLETRLFSGFEDLHVERFGLLPWEHPVHYAEPLESHRCVPTERRRAVGPQSDGAQNRDGTAFSRLSSTVRRSASPTP